MLIDIITVFPNQIDSFLKEGVFRIAREKGLVEVVTHDLRKWSKDKRKTVDDRPYGGGAGMILIVEPLYKAIKELKQRNSYIIFTSPSGEKLTQNKSESLSKLEHIIIIAGHYEGIDQRIIDKFVNEEVSIGDYVLSGGELPALVISDSIIRLIPGVLGNTQSLLEESFNDGLLEYPQYSRPSNYEGMKVPQILLNGNHKEISDWKKQQSLEKTKRNKKP